MTSWASRRRVALRLVAATIVFAAGITLEKAEAGERGAHAETLFGIETESTPLIILAVVASLLVAAVVWRLGDRPRVLWATAAFCGAFAIADLVEVARKVQGDEATIAALATVVAALHLAAAISATMQARGATPLARGTP
jgi:hypothetical protein